MTRDWRADLDRFGTLPVCAATVEDFHAVALMQILFADTEGHKLAYPEAEKIARGLLENPRVVVFLVGDDQPKGMAIASFQFDQGWQTESLVAGSGLYILPEFRSIRAVCSLIRACMGIAEASGVSKVFFNRIGLPSTLYSRYAEPTTNYVIRMQNDEQ